MNIPTKSAGNFSLPILGLGTWRMGEDRLANSANADARDIAGIKAAIAAGITHIDTAEVYAGGHAEEVVAKAIQGVGRDRLFITSKVSVEHLRYDEVLVAAQSSLKRLGLKYLDLYLIHGPDPEVPLTETIAAMDDLLAQGLIRNIGVSNFDRSLLAAAQHLTKTRIVTNQIEYSLLAREHEQNGTLAYCQQQGILVTAYRPLGKGVLASSEQPLLPRLAAKYQKTPAQIALNWVINKPNVVALVKTSDPQHLEEDLGALGWQLSSTDERLLDEQFPRGVNSHWWQRSV